MPQDNTTQSDTQPSTEATPSIADNPQLDQRAHSVISAIANNGDMLTEAQKLQQALGSDHVPSNKGLPDLSALGMSKKMQKKLRKNKGRLPPELQAQLANMPEMGGREIEEAGGMEALMKAGQKIAKRAVGQNVTDVEGIQNFLTTQKNQDDIIASGKEVMSQMQSEDACCHYCQELILGRKVACPRCQKIFYCGGKCRKADYRQHKKKDCL